MASKNTASPRKTDKYSYEEMTKQLIDHSIKLQEKNAEMINSMNRLTNKISEMVELFEDAANHIKSGTDEPLVRKLEVLLEQNKNIARGLVLLEKYVRDETMTGTPSQMSTRPLPKSPF